MRSAPSGPFRVRRPRPPVTALATALLLVTGLWERRSGRRWAPRRQQPARRQLRSPRWARGTSSPRADFTGYGFDQCHAPDQRSMNQWLTHSPFLAVGIYISGNSRACRDQPNLTPQWISTQLAKGWRLLPITLGPQASCQPRFPRYGDDPKINPKRGTDGLYQWARDQGTAEADQDRRPSPRRWASCRAARSGTTSRASTTTSPTAASPRWRSSSAWTDQLHALGYVSGVYSSAGSGIEMLDDARVERPGQFSLPDQIWIARWDGQANTSTSYIREDGWLPGGRMKQYQGGHDETWGGVRINIDRNYLDLGLGSYATRETHCGGTRISYWRYPAVNPGDASQVVPALQCLLKEQGAYAGPITGTYDDATVAAAQAWHELTALGAQPQVRRRGTGCRC